MQVKFIGNIPEQKTTGAAGYDLKSAEDIAIYSGERKLIKTGLWIEIPEGYEGQIRPRSGLAANWGVTVLNSPATIDSDYRGEIKVLLQNFGDKVFFVAQGDRIAQLVFAKKEDVEFIEVEILSDTIRGEGGFGSTKIQ